LFLVPGIIVCFYTLILYLPLFLLVLQSSMVMYYIDLEMNGMCPLGG
jgi:hypothetical protein